MRIERIPYPVDMPRPPIEEPSVQQALRWVATRLAAHGLDHTTDCWAFRDGAKPLPTSTAKALHRTLSDVVARGRSLRLDKDPSIGVHAERWALAQQAEGAVRGLTRNPTAFDGRVFADLFEWSGYVPSGAVEFYLWYAPLQTLRSVEAWLRAVVVSEGVAVHERAFLLRALGRLDRPAAVALARELVVESPWAASEVLGMFGGPDELQLMRLALSGVASQQEARTRRHFEAGMRKLERRLLRSERRTG